MSAAQARKQLLNIICDDFIESYVHYYRGLCL